MKIIVMVMCVVLSAVCANAELTSSDNQWSGKNNFAAPVDMRSDFRIKSTNVTVSAAQINAAGAGTTATLSPTLVSNDTMKVSGATGVFDRVTVNTAITLPSSSVAAASIAGGTMANAMLLSNSANKVYGSTGVFATVTATTSVSAPSYIVGAQTGWTGVITNKMSSYTNFVWVGAGIVTNVTLEGALP